MKFESDKNLYIIDIDAIRTGADGAQCGVPVQVHDVRQCSWSMGGESGRTGRHWGGGWTTVCPSACRTKVRTQHFTSFTRLFLGKNELNCHVP
jgi:hypothetical protein